MWTRRSSRSTTSGSSSSSESVSASGVQPQVLLELVEDQQQHATPAVAPALDRLVERGCVGLVCLDAGGVVDPPGERDPRVARPFVVQEDRRCGRGGVRPSRPRPRECGVRPRRAAASSCPPRSARRGSSASPRAGSRRRARSRRRVRRTARRRRRCPRTAPDPGTASPRRRVPPGSEAGLHRLHGRPERGDIRLEGSDLDVDVLVRTTASCRARRLRAGRPRIPSCCRAAARCDAAARAGSSPSWRTRETGGCCFSSFSSSLTGKSSLRLVRVR